jgi:putative transposase
MTIRRTPLLSEEFNTMKICKTLCVAKSGYYRWKKCPVSKRGLLNEELLETIKLIHEKSRKSFGSPRITVKLKESGYKCNHKRIERLMMSTAAYS